MAATASFSLSAVANPSVFGATDAENKPKIAALLVDTGRVTTAIDERIYGQFLEHINHSVEDGLFAEQIRGAGFEGDDFKTYWESVAERGEVELANVAFQNGSKSVRLRVDGGRAAIRQGRIFLDTGVTYEGSLWLKRETGSPHLTLLVKSSEGEPVASIPLALTSEDWHEVPFAFTSPIRDTQASPIGPNNIPPAAYPPFGTMKGMIAGRTAPAENEIRPDAGTEPSERLVLQS
jgi:alpha-N-arabinofuranosidase